MQKLIALLLFTFLIVTDSLSQTSNSANDTEASNLLKKVSEKYKAYKNIAAEFKLIILRPKLKPDDNDKKFTDTLKGKILMQGAKFNIDIKSQRIICDGKNLWTYSTGDKEVQVNYFEETEDVFSPSKIFSLYNEGYLYQIKEKKTVNGKSITVIEMSPPSKKSSYFKIEVNIDETNQQIEEAKVYEKNGIRYIYKFIKQTPNTNISEESFTFDAKKFPGMKVVDLR